MIPRTASPVHTHQDICSSFSSGFRAEVPHPLVPWKGGMLTARQLAGTSSPRAAPGLPLLAARQGSASFCHLKPAGDLFKNKTSNFTSISKQPNEEWVLPGGILPLGLALPWARPRFLWMLSSGGEWGGALGASSASSTWAPIAVG